MDKLGRVMGKINSQKDLRDTLKNNRENWPFGEKIAILYDFANDEVLEVIEQVIETLDVEGEMMAFQMTEKTSDYVQVIALFTE